MLKPWLRTACHDDRVLLEDGDRVVDLSGGAARTLVPALLPLLDGTRTAEMIVAALGSPVAAAVELALTELARHGVLVEGDGESTLSDRGIADLLAVLDRGASPATLRSELGHQTVAVVGAGSVAEALVGLLRSSGLGDVVHLMVRDGDPDAPIALALRTAELTIAAPAASEPALLERVNDAALCCARPWLQLVPFDGCRAVIGPLFVPADTCCHRCYVIRRAATSGYPDEFQVLSTAPVHASPPPALTAAIAGIATLHAVRWLASRDPAVVGRSAVIELVPAPALTTHTVYRVPRCPCCSAVVGGGLLPWHRRKTA
jgi:bacteriocin biosynthesis cyclodehydratase domain-containing protein